MSRSPENFTPVVPTELEVFLKDDHVNDVIEQWQAADYKTLISEMPEPTMVELKGHTVGAVILSPKDGDIDETNTLVMGLPHQQAWKPSMYLRSELMRQIVAPDTRAVIFPNNSIEQKSYYDFTKEQMVRLHGGDIRPLAEMQAATLEELKIARVALTGYSLGGLTAVALAAVDSDFEVTHLNSDEMPSALRGAKQLQKDFMKSGGWGDQKKSISDSAIPALKEAFSGLKMHRDYMNFGISTLNPNNKALAQAMAGTSEDLLTYALHNHPEMRVKIGRVTGSLLLDGSIEYPAKVRNVEYTGTDARHTAGDNIVTHALMVQDGLIS